MLREGKVIRMKKPSRKGEVLQLESSCQGYVRKDPLKEQQQRDRMKIVRYLLRKKMTSIVLSERRGGGSNRRQRKVIRGLHAGKNTGVGEGRRWKKELKDNLAKGGGKATRKQGGSPQPS